MKTLFQKLSLATTFALALNAGPLRAQDDTAPAPPPGNDAIAAPSPSDSGVSFQTFYDQLAGQGTWVQTDQYGYVFQPSETNPNWQPYTYGHWVNTDAGMTWVSDDSFGWATDHYGRWANLNNYGWVWVPGYTWAPAWVSWRQSDDYVGWAPLPPDTEVGVDYDSPGVSFGLGFHIGDDCDTAFGIGPAWYNFCPVAYFGDNDCWRHFSDRRDNFTIINRTTNITNINVSNNRGAGAFGRVRAGGPSLARLDGRLHTPLERASLTAATSPREAGLHGNRLAAFAPRIDPATIKTARPREVSGHLANTTVNRGTDINQPLRVTHSLRSPNPTAAQVHAATLAQSHYSSNARIATTTTRISHPLSQPLTSLRAETHGNAVAHGPVAHTGAASVALEPKYSGGESRATGEATTHHEATPPVADRNFTGAPATALHRTATVHHAPAYAANTRPAYHPQASVYHPSASVYHPRAAAPAVHHDAPAFHASAPVHHAPQASFHAAAPAAHVGGGGHPSGGGAHASAGNDGKHR